MHAWPEFEWLAAHYGRASWQAACLVPLVLAAAWLLRRRLSPRWRYLLWLPVVLRLALPVIPASPVSLFRWVGSPPPLPPSTARAAALPSLPSSPRPEPSGGESGPRVPTLAPASAAIARNKQRPDAVPSEAASRVQASHLAGNPRPATEATGANSADPSRPLVSPARSLPWLALGWATGVVVVASIALAAWARLRRRVRRWPVVQDPRVRAIWEECRQRMNVRRHVHLVESPEISGPALLGGAGLWLLLPSGLAQRLSDDECRHVFLHELAHVRRRDPALALVLLLVQALHWFNPVVWWALGRMRDDREIATDALALERGDGADPVGYGLTIVKLLEDCAPPAAVPGLIGILERRGLARRRIEAIAAAGPRATLRASLLGVLLLGGLVAVGLTDSAGRAGGAEAAGSPLRTEPTILGLRGVAPAPLPTNGPVVRVTVLDASTGAPIRGARVIAPNEAAHSGQMQANRGWSCDAAGRAEIRLGEIPQPIQSQTASLALSVRAPGYAPEGRSWAVPKGDVRPGVPGQLTVSLHRGIPLSGIVVDAAGRPVAGAHVEVWGRGYQFEDVTRAQEQNYPEYWSWTDGAGPIRTDAQGRWQIADFPQHLNLAIVDVRRDGGPRERFVAVGPNGAGNGGSPPNEQGLPLRLAELRDGTARLQLPPAFPIHGRVLGTDGRPIAGARVVEGYGAWQRWLGAECLTDAAGRFLLPNRSERELVLSAEAEGHALTSVLVVPGPTNAPTEIRLAPARPLLLTVRDASGHPLPGVTFQWDSFRSDPHAEPFQGVTGPDGRLRWDRAPTGRLAFVLESPLRTRPRRVVLPPDPRAVEVSLRPGEEREIRIQGRVIDAETGEGLEVSVITPRPEGYGAGLPEAFEPTRTPEGPGFRLTLPLERFSQGIEPDFRLVLRVPRFGVVITEPRNFDEGDWTFVLPARRGGHFQGTLLLPGGEPARGARVVSPVQHHWQLFETEPRRFWKERRTFETETDEHGRFALDAGAEAALVTHPGGCLELTLAMLATNDTQVLNRWGEVRGQLLVDGRPVPAASLFLRLASGHVTGLEPSIRDQTTDDQGRFRFTNVPPGEARLSRPIPTSRRHDGIVETHPRPVIVRPGEITEVRYTSDGRRVEGSLPPELDWQASAHSLTPLYSATPPPPADPDRHTTQRSLASAVQRHLADQVHGSWSRTEYYLQMENEVSFRIEDVPPGKYELKVTGRPRRTTPPSGPDAPLLAWTRILEVPPPPPDRPYEPLRLGRLDITSEAPSAASGVPPGR